MRSYFVSKFYLLMSLIDLNIYFSNCNVFSADFSAASVRDLLSDLCLYRVFSYLKDAVCFLPSEDLWFMNLTGVFLIGNWIVVDWLQGERTGV